MPVFIDLFMDIIYLYILNYNIIKSIIYICITEYFDNKIFSKIYII